MIIQIVVQKNDDDSIRALDIFIQMKAFEPGENAPPSEGYFDFTGRTFKATISDIADVSSNNLFIMRRFSLPGIPYKSGPLVYCSELRDWSPPVLVKDGTQHSPHAYSLSAGETNTMKKVNHFT